MLSIVIPTYNHAIFIGKLLTRLLSYDDLIYEIIVCNDCSTDNTSEILNEFRNCEKIKIIKNPSNIGCMASIGEIYKYVQGNYLVFLASDDYFLEEPMRELYSKMVIENSNIGFGKYKIEAEDGLIEVNHPGWINIQKVNNNFLNLLMFDHYIFLGGAIIKKDALLSLGKNFNPFEIELDKLVLFDGLGEFRAHDWNLVLEISKIDKNKITFIEKTTGIFRKVENQLSSDDRYLFTGRSAFEMAILILKYFRNHEVRVMINKNRENIDIIRRLLMAKISQIKKDKINVEYFELTYLPVIKSALQLLDFEAK